MSARVRSRVAAGLVLILFGGWLMAVQFEPLRGLGLFSWPLIIIGVGIFFLVLGLLSREPGMAVPACIIGGVGGLLYYQSATGDWASWMYAWTLVPGFVGVGLVVADLFSEGPWALLRAGAWLALISLTLFVLVGTILGALSWPAVYWPVVIIGWGLILLVRSLFRRRLR